jgi:hypothetical protein
MTGEAIKKQLARAKKPIITKTKLSKALLGGINRYQMNRLCRYLKSKGIKIIDDTISK